jgi:ribosomal-protein-alanine N-acetyltransferase
MKMRWMNIRDVGQVSQIEKHSNETYWCQEDFYNTLNHPDIINYVVIDENDVVAYVVLSLFENEIEILNFNVHKDYRRRGIGTSLMDYLKTKLVKQWQRNKLRIEVRETNIDAQEFLKINKFIATNVLKDWFKDEVSEDVIKKEDAYLFYFKVSE